jgi:hypothetical protein
MYSLNSVKKLLNLPLNSDINQIEQTIQDKINKIENSIQLSVSNKKKLLEHYNELYRIINMHNKPNIISSSSSFSSSMVYKNGIQQVKRYHEERKNGQLTKLVKDAYEYNPKTNTKVKIDYNNGKYIV